MDALNVIREAIESLSAEEKIDDGKYLELMNHMKTVYGSMPQPRPEADGIPVVRQRISAPPEQFTDRFINRYLIASHFTEEGFLLWGHQHDEVDGYTFNEFAMMLDDILKDNGEEFNAWLYSPFERYFTDSNIGHHFCHTLYAYDIQWRDENMREKFLNLTVVRERTIKKNISNKKWITDSLLILKDTTNPGQWAKMMYKVGFHLMNGMKYTSRKQETTPRTEAELKKLHLVRVEWRMNERENMTVNLYTDKIQLGRTQCVQQMYRMAVIYALLFPEFNAPLERFLHRMSGKANISLYPVMSMSGITAHTRNKNRTYKQKDGDFTITYISTLNDVDA
jgi:hypothetical protein